MHNPPQEWGLSNDVECRNKHPVNTKSYDDTEMQLFANLHLSASQFIVTGLVEQSLSTIDIIMMAYGLVLKPASNQVILYKLVAEFNKPTYIQIESGLFWRVHFNRALRYTFDKLMIARDSVMLCYITSARIR